AALGEEDAADREEHERCAEHGPAPAVYEPSPALEHPETVRSTRSPGSILNGWPLPMSLVWAHAFRRATARASSRMATATSSSSSGTASSTGWSRAARKSGATGRT